MRVRFKRSFFTKDARHYEKNIWHDDVPDDLVLPPGAEVDERMPELAELAVLPESEPAPAPKRRSGVKV